MTEKNQDELQSPLPLKAYKNLDFLNSPDARIIRVLSEFIEPQGRLRRSDVHNTVVFFGSARTASPEDKPTEEWAKRLGKYYEHAATLAGKLSTWSQTIENPRKRF